MRKADIRTKTWSDFSDLLLACRDVYAPDDKALALRNDVETRRTIEVFDYGEQADTFTRAFGMRNALKCFASLVAAGIDAGSYRNVRDLGCGSGAFSLAFAFLADNAELELTGIDGSDRQIAIARRLFEVAGLNVKARFLRRNLPSDCSGNAEITLSSFWFCENRHAYRDPALFDLMAGPEMIVVDYEEVIREIADMLPKSTFSVSTRRVDIAVPPEIVLPIGQSHAGAHSLHAVRR
ncbi:class I SAM-dependent methyltransferase [Pararhizobium sp. BT-229]|uniref:class I SAM-dependent methyltransferase n=1 Tax=Pararhizobium sp. BT-229 TaxID=2986923 RepID=UPI0021F7E0C6|nr:class I SAM-dependent methyltransferase [Pararhizobium sp. BT-229]MCV9963961.1 class I SAM-dependent methyltransferase [Pararhizobium sp. BT-229]